MEDYNPHQALVAQRIQPGFRTKFVVNKPTLASGWQEEDSDDSFEEYDNDLPFPITSQPPPLPLRIY